MQLGHWLGVLCSNSAIAPQDFVVLHTNGFHPVMVHFCACEQMSTAVFRTKLVLHINNIKNQLTETQQISNSTGNAPEQDKEMQPSCNKLIKETDSDMPSDSWPDIDHKQSPKTTLVKHNTTKALEKLSHTYNESIATYKRY